MLGRLLHTPAPGHFAYIASSGLTDRVVLDSFNGRPSLLVLEIDAVPVLAWMMHGHGQDVELWAYVPLERDEAESLIDQPPVLLAGWLAQRAGREIFLGLARDGILLLTALWTVPTGPASGIPPAASAAILEELDRTLRLQDELPTQTRWALSGSELRFRECAETG